MNNKSRATRFLIDKVDNRLGSVEKELKFDKIVIFVGLGIMVVFAFIMGLTINKAPVIALMCLLFVMFGLFLSYVMLKEYLDDLKKSKNNQQ